METAEQTVQPQQQRNFAIPGCIVTIINEDTEGVPVEQLLSIVFNLASSNPGAKVDFWVKVMSGDTPE